MNSNKFSKKSIIFAVILLLCNALVAQDTIKFTWQNSHGYADYFGGSVVIRATDGEQFTINWGDTIETKTGLGDTDIHLWYEYAQTDVGVDFEGERTVTIATSNDDCKFTYFDCETDATDDVVTFRITNLTLSGCSDLAYLNCLHNGLQLSDLYAMHLIINEQSGKLFGTQYLPYQPLTGGMTLDFSEQKEFGGVETFFMVHKDRELAIVDVDYSIDGGVITLINDGEYRVSMTNGAIISHPNYPTEVIAGYDITRINIPEHSLANIKIYPNPTSDFVHIQTENGIIPELKLYSLDGRLLQQIHNTEINLSNYAAGVYLLSVDGRAMKIVKK